MYKDYKERLLKFLEGKPDRELEALLRKLVRESAFRMEKALKRKYGDNYQEEVYSELIYRLWLAKGKLINLEAIYLNYIRSTIKNLLVDLVNGYAKHEHYSLSEIVFENEEGRSVSFEELLKDERLIVASADTESMITDLLKRLDKKDTLVLCYYFTLHLYGEKLQLKNLSKNNLYKRWERLKPKLKELLEGLSHEEIRAFMEAYLSGVCKSLGLYK